MPIHVLHPITRLIVGGAQENTMYTAALLDKQRFTTEILSGPQTGSEGSLIEEVRERGIPLTILPEMQRQISPKYDSLALWKLVQKIRQGGYTIVHTHSSKAGILGRIAARLAGVPVIVHTVHGWSFHDYMPAKIRLTYIYLERLTASFSHALIAVAQKDIDKGLRHQIGKPDQYHLIRSAIPLEAFNPDCMDKAAIRQELGLPLGIPVLGNVGRFSEQKNPLDWVRAAGQVGQANPDVHFLLVGDGPLRPQVEAALKEERIYERTILTGLRRDPARMMAAMDVFLMTTLWEGMPRVIPEAMSMGIPVVAYMADGTSEAILQGETGFLVQPGNIEEATGRCLDLINNRSAGLLMGQRGRQIAMRDFDVNEMVNQIASLYEQLLKRMKYS